MFSCLDGTTQKNKKRKNKRTEKKENAESRSERIIKETVGVVHNLLQLKEPIVSKVEFLNITIIAVGKCMISVYI